MKNLEIEYLDINDVREYPGNANIHSDGQIDAIAKSILEFGIMKPVLVDADNVLITGHGTRLGAIRAGHTKIPVIRNITLSPRQVAAYRLADNQLAKQSRYDFELLANEVDALVDMNFDISLLGFNEQELDAMLSDDAGVLPAEWTAPKPVKAKEPEPAPSVRAKIVRDIVCPKCKHTFQG